jgi:hypothetical protein
LIQDGQVTYWITELGTKEEYSSFDNFVNEIKSEIVLFNEDTLTYKNLELTYLGDFKVDDEVMDLNYMRFDNKYSKTERKADVITIEFNGQSLELDFNNLTRKVVN